MPQPTPLIPYVWPSVLTLATPKATTSWIQVAKTGTFFSQRYGTFSITSDDLRQMLHNFTHITPIAPTQLPVDYDHLSMDPKKPGDGKAAGWFVTGRMELREHDTELWAEVAWTPEAAEAITNGEYRFVSPSFVRDYVWKNGTNIGTTLVAAAITNHPFLEGMAAVTLSSHLGDVAVPIEAGRTDLGMGYDDRRQRVTAALYNVLGYPSGGYPIDCYVRDLDDTWVVYQIAGKTFRRGYAMDENGMVTVSPAVEEVIVQWTPLQHVALKQETVMSDVFTLRDVRGTEVEVKPEGLQQFLADQIAAAKDEAKKTAVPEGSVVIAASKVQEFEATSAKVTELTDTVTSLSAAAETAQKETHALKLRTKLDGLSQAGRLSKPQRDWAEKTFAAPTSLAAFEEWAATVPTTPLVPLNREHGSGAGAERTDQPAASDLNALALTRSKEKGISFVDAAKEIAAERQDLITRYREDTLEAPGPVREVVRH